MMMAERTAIKEELGLHKQWYVDAKSVTTETLPEFVRHLTEDFEHDYGTICHAVAACALAAAQAVNKSSQGGITGFQSGAIMWEFIQEWQHLRDKPMRLIQYEDMLYPQYEDKFWTINPETWKHLQETAQKRLAEADDPVHEDVRKHWQTVADGIVPFGYTVAAS